MNRAIIAAMALVLLTSAEAHAFERNSGMILGGSLNAPIRVEIFSDFQCPGCRLFYREVVVPTLQEYASRDKVCVIYHEYPLIQHRYAPNAARYCEAAYLMGRNQALKVIDALFSNQSQWSEDGKIEAALAKVFSKQEFAKLKSNLRQSSIDKSIRQGIVLGEASGVRGTPTMFVYYPGGKEKVENPQQMSYPIFKSFYDRHAK